MLKPIKKASTDESVMLRVIDSTDGTPETTVAYNTAGVDLWYRREGAVSVDVTEVTLATVDAAHADGGFIHINDGYCRLDLPDAAFAAGANGVLVGGTFTGMIVIGCYVPLVDYDPYDTVRLGLTALPNAAADAGGGLPISDAGELDLDAMNTAAVRLTAARAQVLDDWINDGRLDILLDAIPTTAMRGTDNAAIASVVGALDNVAAAGDPTDADTLMQYLKQLINVLIGTAGIGAFPAEAAPANAVSLAEVIRAIHADVTGLNGDAMVGTNSAALASVCTEGRLAELDAANIPTDLSTIAAYVDELESRLTAARAGYLDELDAANLPTDIADIPTVAEFEARTIVAANYFDPSADTVALVTAITNDVGITQAGADKAWGTAARALTDKADFALSSASRAAIWDETEAITGQTHSFETILARLYRFILNKEIITNSTGAVALRNEADDADIGSQGITDNSTLTTRTAFSWV